MRSRRSSSSSLFNATSSWRGCSARRSRLAALLGFALASTACSSGAPVAPGDGKIGAASNALDPSGVIPATTYTVQLAIPSTTAQEPSAPSPWWTPDTGFVYWAELAAKVDNGSGTTVGPVVSSACVLGSSINPHTGALGNCEAGSQANGAFTQNQPLSVQFTVTGPTDVATLAIALDNIESTDPATLVSHTKDDLAAAGDGVAGAGAIIGAVCPWCGAIVGAIGAGLSITADLLGSPSNNPATELTCAGGLIGSPSPSTPKVRPDTLYVQLTPAQLAQLTASGPGTLSYNAVTETAFPSPGVGTYCDASTSIQLTVTRNWSSGSGPAASAKSSDSAVVGQVNGMDHFSVITSPVPGVVHEFLGSEGWSTELITSTSLAGSQPVFKAGTKASVSAISRSVTSYDVFFVDDAGSLWWAFSRSPGIWNASIVVPAGAPSSPPASGHLTAIAPVPGTLSVFWIGLNGAVESWSITDTTINGSVQPSGNPEGSPMGVSLTALAPPGAPIASVARTAGNIDLFFAGKDALNASNGGIWTASMSGGVWNTSYPASPVYTGGTWQTYELPYTSGVVAQGADVTAAAESEANLDVFYAGTDGGIWTSSWNLANANYTNAPFSNGKPAFLTSELAGTKGLAASGQPLSVVSPQPAASEIPNTASTTPGSLQVAWVSRTDAVLVSSLVGTSWGAGPTTIVGATAITGGASPTSPISIIAPSSSSLAVLFDASAGGLYAATWKFGAPSYTLSAKLPSWQWQGWDNAQGGLISDTALAAPNPDELWVAATAPNGAVWYANYTGWGNWTGWQSLGKGNAITDGPALVAVNGKLEVFVRDPVTTHLLHQEGICESVNVCNYPTWNTAGWEDLGGTLIAGTPSVVISQPNNQINVFATWTDNAAHTMQGTGYGSMARAWTNLSGGVLSEPAAVSWGPSRIDVIVRGGNDQLYKRYSTDNGATWNPSGGNWQDIGGVAYSTPTIVSWGPSRFDIFAGGGAGQVTHMGYNDGGPFNWDTVPGLTMPLGVRPAAVARGVGHLDVFGQSTASGLFTSTLSGYGTPASAWSSWAELSSCFRKGGTPAVVSRDGAGIDLVMTAYAANGDANVWHNSTAGFFNGQNGSQPPLCQ